MASLKTWAADRLPPVVSRGFEGENTIKSVRRSLFVAPNKNTVTLRLVIGRGARGWVMSGSGGHFGSRRPRA